MSDNELNLLRKIRANGMALESVPEERRTHALCLAAVMQNGMAVKFVPDGMRTDAVCLAAVNRTIAALAYLECFWRQKHMGPMFQPTLAQCVDAVQQEGGNLYALSRIAPEEVVYREEVLLAAINSSPAVIFNIPHHRATEKVCEAVLRIDTCYLCALPPDYARRYIDRHLVDLGTNAKDQPYTYFTAAIKHGWPDIAREVLARFDVGWIVDLMVEREPDSPETHLAQALQREVQLAHLAQQCPKPVSHPSPARRRL